MGTDRPRGYYIKRCRSAEELRTDTKRRINQFSHEPVIAVYEFVSPAFIDQLEKVIDEANKALYEAPNEPAPSFDELVRRVLHTSA
jgi:hypothetical protein